MYNRQDTKKPAFINKKLCIYSCRFKLQPPSKYSPFDAIHLSRCFFHCSKRFLNSSILMPLVLLPLVVSHLPYRQKVSLWGLFSSGEMKKVRWGEMGWGTGVMLVLVKNFWIFTAVLAGVLRCTHKTPIMKWANIESSKKFTEAECSLSQQRQLVHWYRWIPRTLTYLGKPVLQGVNPPEDNSILGGSHPHVYIIQGPAEVMPAWVWFVA